MPAVSNKNWFSFGMSYLYIADLACTEMRRENGSEYYSADLYIATIFNIKHGIEVNLKSLIVLLEKKRISKRLEHHNQISILEELYRLISENKIIKLINELTEKNRYNKEWIFREVQDKNEFLLKIKEMMRLVLKYHRLDFLKEKIGDDFIIEDTSNTAFKYPQNNLPIKLDYEKILQKVNKNDVYKIALDVVGLINYFLTLNILFDECIKEQETNK